MRNNFDEIRVELEVTIDDIAEQLDVKEEAVINWLCNKEEIPQTYINELAEWLGFNGAKIPFSVLLYEDDADDFRLYMLLMRKYLLKCKMEAIEEELQKARQAVFNKIKG